MRVNSNSTKVFPKLHPHPPHQKKAKSRFIREYIVNTSVSLRSTRHLYCSNCNYLSSLFPRPNKHAADPVISTHAVKSTNLYRAKQLHPSELRPCWRIFTFNLCQRSVSWTADLYMLFFFFYSLQSASDCNQIWLGKTEHHRHLKSPLAAVLIIKGSYYRATVHIGWRPRIGKL